MRRWETKLHKLKHYLTHGADAPRRFLWVIPLAAHVHPIQFFAYMVAIFVVMAVIVYLAAAQSFVLTSILSLYDDTGNITGNLALYGEITAIVFVIVWGITSDWAEKRTIYCISICIMGLPVILYPYAKNVYPDLLLMKLVFSIGSAGCTTMMVAIMIDVSYGQGGLVAGIVGACSGLGPLFAAFELFRVPSQLSSDVEHPQESLYQAFGIIGGATIFLGIVLWFFLPRAGMYRLPLIHLCLWEGVKMMRDPRVILGYASSFFARADEIIISNFISLWLTQYYIDRGDCTVGTPCYQALGQSGVLTGISQAVALATIPLFALVSEFLPRPVGLILAGLVGAAGCFPFSFSIDPTSSYSQGFIILLAAGQYGMIICGMAHLNGDVVPKKRRGTVSGMFSFIGSVGIIIVSKVGGVLFDTWMKGAPFLLLGIGHCIVVVLSVILFPRVYRLDALAKKQREEVYDHCPASSTPHDSMSDDVQEESKTSVSV
ncbi:transmembrane transporter [Malassezia pachydermatis]